MLRWPAGPRDVRRRLGAATGTTRCSPPPASSPTARATVELSRRRARGGRTQPAALRAAARGPRPALVEIFLRRTIFLRLCCHDRRRAGTSTDPSPRHTIFLRRSCHDRHSRRKIHAEGRGRRLIGALTDGAFCPGAPPRLPRHEPIPNLWRLRCRAQTSWSSCWPAARAPGWNCSPRTAPSPPRRSWACTGSSIFRCPTACTAASSDVWVLQQYQPASLNDHLANGRPWDLDRTTGGLLVLPPYEGTRREGFAQGTADGLWRNAGTDPAGRAAHRGRGQRRCRLPSRLLAGGARTPRVGGGAHHGDRARSTREDAGRYGVVQVDGDSTGSKVVDYAYKPDDPKGNLVSNEVFVFDPHRCSTCSTRSPSEHRRCRRERPRRPRRRAAPPPGR